MSFTVVRNIQVFGFCVGDIQRCRFHQISIVVYDFFHCSSCGGDGRVTCGISTIPRVSRSLLSKGPSLSLESLEDMLSCSDSATFCHVLSTCQCFHTHPFHEDLRSNGYTSLRILPRFLSLWLLFRRALCQRRPRRRVGCSGQAVPCLVLRRFQQAVLVYMRSC